MKNSIKRNVHFYSERGMVNTIIWYLKREASDEDILSFFHQIRLPFLDDSLKFKEQEIISIDIYDEYSFGHFGDPDLIIKVKTKKDTFLFFFEAKVTNFEDNSISLIDNIIDYKGKASLLNIQLWLKYRFIKALEEKKIDGIVSEKSSDKNDYKRQLKKKSVINFIEENIINVDINNVFYIGLVSSDDKIIDYKSYFKNDSFFRAHFGTLFYDDIWINSDANSEAHEEFKNAYKLAINTSIQLEKREPLSQDYFEKMYFPIIDKYELKNSFKLIKTVSSFSITYAGHVEFKVFKEKKSSSLYFILRNEARDTYISYFETFGIEFDDYDAEDIILLNEDTVNKICKALEMFLQDVKKDRV